MDKRTKQILALFLAIAVVISINTYLNQCDCKTRISYDTINVLDGIDLDHLFAVPDSSELESVRTMWANFDASSTDIKVLKSFDYLGNWNLDIVSHHAESRQHFGAVICPKEKVVDIKYPVLLWGHGLDQNDPTIDLNGSHFFKALLETFPNYIVVIPAYRGQAIALDGKRYCADGFFGDAYDGATDDALRILEIVKEKYPVNLNRIATYGISRGGTVAMLTSIRDTSIRCVVTQSGPMQFHKRQAYDMYNVQFKYQFLNNVKPMKELRAKLIAASPIYFADQYSKPVLILQGKQDPIVPVSNATDLADALKSQGKLILREDDHFLEEFALVKKWLLENNEE